ncbi:3-ketoacyl-CoA synthase 11-like protein, partial [Tanacetum coccineum]
VYSKVFRSWDWTYNANLCSKGYRIILGWNLDIVNMVVVSQSSQVMHVKIVHKAFGKQFFCSFVYASNSPSTRRILWDELGMHKLVTHGVSWTLMGDFNVALNLEDYSSSSSKLSSAISEFKDCVYNIEVMDITSSGLHFTWNQKPKGEGGLLKKLYHVLGNTDFIDAFPDHGNLHDRVNKLRVELDTVQKALDLNPNDVNFRDEEAILNSANVEVTGTDVANAFVSHYENFLGSDMVNSDGLFMKQVSENSYSNMVSPITDEEIKSAMFSIGGDRAPGLDGFSSAFFKRVMGIFMVFKGNRGLRQGDPLSPYLFTLVMGIFMVFKGNRGLRQGDPLSPYLFTLVMEVLSLMIKQRVSSSGLFRYHKHCEELQLINVCFGDDLFIFARGDMELARVIMDALKEFKSTLGLVLSLPKSTAFFCNVLNHTKLVILNIMPFSKGELPVKYLGVPLISSRLLNKDCKILV